ncbi:hypothetical protein IC582_003045 [Cucumis melo]
MRLNFNFSKKSSCSSLDEIRDEMLRWTEIRGRHSFSFRGFRLDMKLLYLEIHWHKVLSIKIFEGLVEKLISLAGVFKGTKKRGLKVFNQRKYLNKSSLDNWCKCKVGFYWL